MSAQKGRLSIRRKSIVHSELQVAGGYRPEFASSVGNTPVASQSTSKIWKLMEKYLPNSKEAIQSSVVNHVEYTLAKTRFDFTLLHCYQAVSHSVRDRLIEAFNDTYQYFNNKDVKYVYYLSLEYLIGRCLQNALVNLELEGQYKEAMLDMGYNLESVYEQEVDPALGNGGLGRLAACFLDSMATLNYPAWGYGLRYSYGIFRQQIKDGYQVEVPDYWLDRGNPWEIERLDVNYQIKFYGSITKKVEDGKERTIWEGSEIIVARAYDNPIPGYNTFNTINLRLWRSLPSSEFDFKSFNQGDYFKALESRQRAEFITSVLYPNDSTYAGKELRLKQQYLLVSATIQDAIRRFKKKRKEWKEWPKYNALQLNDTHPALAIVELMRILTDIEGLEYEEAWEVVYNSFAYTNHTILPEALEKWGVELLGNLLPRHLEIIYNINHIFLEKISRKYPNDWRKLSTLSLVEEGTHKTIRMANLSIVGSHAVNGVAALHSQLLTTNLFKDFYELRPAKFQNKTNGVTPRRWIRCANPGLSALLNDVVGSDDWILDMDILKNFQKIADDPAIQNRWMQVKRQNKEKLYWWVKERCGVDLNIDSLFDIQVKRIHEYKRQLMNILYVIRRYLDIKKTPAEERRKLFVPRSIMFGGKAAPGYITAKRIIRLVNAVSQKVNNDQEVGDLLKVVFLPNYNVSNAQVIIPASELSQHISTAGLEASGTSNMKFVMNGCLIIGTMDGANVEIAEEVGEENMFIFGARVEQVEELRNKMRNSNYRDYFGPRLTEVCDAISSDLFGYKYDLDALLDTIRNKNDYYILGADFESYCEAQQRVDNLYRNKSEWTKKSILNSLRSGKFSSDRTIRQYAEEIWDLEPCEIPNPSKSEKERFIQRNIN
ncbi:glycogen/starch/alpha-glucan phosphorylase (macronuclear) [Tetrahymena thermophila SB210]|uniref:Alpha-1,4 glucan phosphorylase n=1 Tax=Tetrahymena thermophila (strain SB210) TaxID=312017 RepID=Q23GD4_TETTS|nr:glycogen/starch/alpha-glucan phosphorylase [Tetrahymena thermophila SB210]EAR95326.2 glycogen/starch/alpha-glucan phosphorylase [Tetrahymena thermophila SB210]|eukprot:XP_001015571.2 glycogen/starch/alpha-glucan phosphorylase [Tetrahymena thermophila SB210]